MNLSQLRAAVAVADLGNFSEAALSLHLTQSTVSHAIASLEEELGISLFVRGRHGATVTPAGERIVSYARQALRLIDLMQQEATLQRSLKGGEVRIAAFRSVATHLLPSVIVQFRERFPEVSVAIVECPEYLDAEQLLREGRADIGFTYLPTSDEFESWEIVRDEYVLLLPPQIHLKTEPPTWAEVATLPLILPPEDQPSELELYRHFATQAPPLNVSHYINQDSTIVSMVMQGLGVGILPRLAAEPIPGNIRVQSLPTPFERVIGVIMLSTALHVPAVFAFLELLRQMYSATLSIKK
ncbi:MAG: LysR family transcriptional regulator [Elainellaceae cyanobacterium]